MRSPGTPFAPSTTTHGEMHSPYGIDLPRAYNFDDRYNYHI